MFEEVCRHIEFATNNGNIKYDLYTRHYFNESLICLQIQTTDHASLFFLPAFLAGKISDYGILSLLAMLATYSQIRV